MTTTYEDIINKPSTEKVTLVTIEPVQRFLIWTLESGKVYKRTVEKFVVNLTEGGIDLSEGSSSSLSSGEWWYNPESNIVYVRTTDDSNPNTKDIYGTYRLFYSDAPLTLPYDLSSGTEVEFEGRLKTFSPVTKQLDEEQVGVALESQTSLMFDNGDGHFDDFFDVYFFENKNMKAYSWSPLIPLSEKKLLFDGFIQDKQFSPRDVKIKAKDYVFKLRERVQLGIFSASDGNILDTYIDTPKRRIYGKFKNLDCVGVDNILDGFNLTGTFAASTGSLTIVGTSSVLLDEASPEDTIFIETAVETYELEIESVDSDTQITISEEFPTSITGATIRIKPARPWRKKNRTWFIADHKLRSPSTTVDTAEAPNRFTVVDGTDLSGVVKIDGETATIKRISGNQVVLRSNLQGGTPSNGDTVTKSPVEKVFIQENEAIIDRDFTVTNTTEAKIVFENAAEFNIAKPRSIIGTVTFTNASRSVTATGVDFTNYLQTRDWIRSDDIAHTTWYEILSVSESSLELRTAYAGSNNAGSAEIKNPNLINDESLITVDCLGLERSSVWIKTGPQIVKDLIEQDAGLLNTNATSFTNAQADAPHLFSMAIPEKLGQDKPTIKKTITKINESIFGSLTNNIDWEIVYNVLTPDKPEDTVEIGDHDIIGDPSIASKNEIVRAVNLKYRPFTDVFTGEQTTLLEVQTSDFVDNYIGQKDELDITCYLYDQDSAQEIAQRYLLYKSLSTSTIKIKSKLQFILKNLNDKVLLNLDRLYKRFGNLDRRKIGTISKITKSGGTTAIEVNDLGNVFTRVMSIAPNAANEFTSADDSEKINNAYITDDDLKVPDTTSDAELGRNLIG